jgi:hypothetical protein
MEAICSSERSVHTKLHGGTYQKTAFFIVAAVKTSNPTRATFCPEEGSKQTVVITILSSREVWSIHQQKLARERYTVVLLRTG